MISKKTIKNASVILIITLSFSVLLSWQIGLEQVLNLIPNAPTMKFNTALLFLLIAISIQYVNSTKRALHFIGLCFAFLTFIISLLTVSEYIFSVNIGIDNLFLRDEITENYPGRMSRATAFCFLILASAKILRGLELSRAKKITNYLVTLVAIVSLMVIATYFLQFFAAENVLVFNSMAIHTAILFFLASLAISLKHPDHSYVGFLTGGYVGNKQARSLLPFVVGLPILLSAVLLYTLNSDFLTTSYGVALYTISYAVISIFYFSFIFQKLNKSDQQKAKLLKELQATNQELSQYKLALDESSIITITDNEGRLTYVNQKFVNISGYSKEEALGKKLDIVNSGHHPKSFFQELWNTIKKGEVWVGGIKNRTKAGDFYWVHTVIVPLKSTSGEIDYFISIKQDISQKTILSNQYENLKLKNKEIEQFTYLASHDLQEPLKTMKSMSSLLQKRYTDQLDEEGEKIINFISNSSHRMSEMVKALLDYSLIGVKRELERVNTAELVTTITKDLGDLIESNDAVITTQDLPTVNAYRTELRLLFQNLLANSIKFRATDRELKVSVSAIKREQVYQFCVEDNGIGISKDKLIEIFSLFKQLHKKGSYKGTGIGLAHAEKIVHLHGGSIWAESEPGKGTLVFFTIPIF